MVLERPFRKTMDVFSFQMPKQWQQSTKDNTNNGSSSFRLEMSQNSSEICNIHITTEHSKLETQAKNDGEVFQTKELGIISRNSFVFETLSITYEHHARRHQSKAVK